MSDNQKKLLIVSDTPMWGTREGRISVFEPTLREVEWLADMFTKIVWIGYGYPNTPQSFSRASIKSNIEFVLLPYARGGTLSWQKLKIIPFLPRIFFTIVRHLRNHKLVHTRGPSVPALITILISFFDNSRTYWHKYAGNWRQYPAPKAYALQRFLLRYNQHTISINGTWANTPSNFINLENPCLTTLELESATEFVKRKPIPKTVTICFVGGLVHAKGIHPFVDALELVSAKDYIKEVIIVGDGAEREAVELKTKKLSTLIKFLGNIKRDAIDEVYKASDIIVLPSDTEGFPKVIAEAAAFGCVPIVSDVSSIGQYIKTGKNGFLLANTKKETIAKALDTVLSDESLRLLMSNEVRLTASLFTYERYCKRVEECIFPS